jgi:hypothetical protein
MNGTKIFVKNFTSNNGNKIPNQFIITYDFIGDLDYSFSEEIFQSYESIIAKKYPSTGAIILDEVYWDYSNTTGKYRNQFLGETKKETERKIKTGEYLLDDLN